MMKNHHYYLNEEEMLVFAGKFANCVTNGACIFLMGPLGVGKTTFTRGFLCGLGYTYKVKSPTYTLVEPYEIADRAIFHFDLYRLQVANELDQIGIRDYFSSDAICLIEWPEKGFPLLPPPDLTCYIAFAESQREIRLEALSASGKKILEKFCK
jgi:tRNA threonylcarbamoyladenosine biosynthesis protein TsaE